MVIEPFAVGEQVRVKFGPQLVQAEIVAVRGVEIDVVCVGHSRLHTLHTNLVFRPSEAVEAYAAALLNSHYNAWDLLPYWQALHAEHPDLRDQALA